jgi:hypothetical protein
MLANQTARGVEGHDRNQLMPFSLIQIWIDIDCGTQSISKNNPDPSQIYCSFKSDLDWISIV